MISAGLCIMGGCFAQDETSRTVDSYWAAASIPVPYSASSLGIYEIQVAIPTPQSQLRWYSRQRVKSGNVSLFFIKQGISAPYNFYGVVNSRFVLQADNSSPQMVNVNRAIKPGEVVEYSLSGNRQGCLTTGDWQDVAGWKDNTVSTVRLLDRRNGEKDFICSAGIVNAPFYVQACCSGSGMVAVYDVEQQTLVEI